MNRTPVTQALKTTPDKWALMKLKSFLLEITLAVQGIDILLSRQKSLPAIHPTKVYYQEYKKELKQQQT